MAVSIELLAAHHNRAGFDCAEPALNAFWQQQAGQLGRKDFGKTYVAVGDGGGVQGFITLSVGQIERVQLAAQPTLPRYPAPVLRLGRLAVDTRWQRQGVGRQLMAFALHLALDFSERVGLYAVLVDAKNDQAQRFYQSLGFVPTLDNPRCLYLPVSTLRQARPAATTQGQGRSN